MPHTPTPKQSAFLLLQDSGTKKPMEAFFGGAAGGGKSDALLMAALQHIEIPNYSAILFRRTFSELALPGSLMTRAHEWLYPHRKAKRVHWSEQKKTYTFFPSGATITFGYLENVSDHFRYQSAEFQTICFDELTHFEMSDYTYLFSRLRRTKALEEAGVPLRMLSASNPGGSGAGWVKQRFITEGVTKGRVFIPATINDNPYLDKESYIESLNELSPLERAQLLEGNWDISAGGQIFKRDWFEILDTLPSVRNGYVPRVRYWDLAATDVTVAKHYNYIPAFTAGLKMAKYKDINNEDLFVIEDVVRFQKTPDDVERLILETAKSDGKNNCEVWMEEEPGSAGKGVINYYRKALQGYAFRGARETGNKIVRANRVSSTAGHGRIKILKGIWNNDFLDEVDFFPNQKIKDQVDCLSGAFDKLSHFASYSVIPTAVGQETQSYWQQI